MYGTSNNIYKNLGLKKKCRSIGQYTNKISNKTQSWSKTPFSTCTCV